MGPLAPGRDLPGRRSNREGDGRACPPGMLRRVPCPLRMVPQSLGAVVSDVLDPRIERALAETDFGAIRAYMEKKGWVWDGMGTPSELSIRARAMGLLLESARAHRCYGRSRLQGDLLFGGLEALVYADRAELRFDSRAWPLTMNEPIHLFQVSRIGEAVEIRPSVDGLPLRDAYRLATRMAGWDQGDA